MPDAPRTHRPRDLIGPRHVAPRARPPYQTARWQRFRAAFLEEHPICATCGEPASDVDHVVPLAGPDDPRFLDPAACQALCHGCHSIKTGAERAGRGS